MREAHLAIQLNAKWDLGPTMAMDLWPRLLREQGQVDPVGHMIQTLHLEAPLCPSMDIRVFICMSNYQSAIHRDPLLGEVSTSHRRFILADLGRV